MSDLLFHQPSVDIRDSSLQLYSAELANEQLLQPMDSAEQLAIDAFSLVVSLKKNAGTRPDRALDISSENVEIITPGRQESLLLARDIAATAKRKGAQISWYGLGDVAEFASNADSLTTLQTGKLTDGDSIFVRLEEALALDAERLISALHIKGTSDDGNVKVADGTLSIKNGETIKTIPLRGYEFNRNALNADEHIYVPNMPSCEAFIAATVLEQVGLAPNIVRVIPYWMKRREMTARIMLRMLGHTDLPVVSVVTGKGGDVDKILPWGEPTGELNHQVKHSIQKRISHRKSTELAKKIHDAVFSDHKELYSQYCHPELDSNTPPSEILSLEYLTERGHEFLSKTLRAAPLYEKKVGSSEAPDLIQDLAMLKELFSLDYQAKGVVFPERVLDVKLYKGKNTNSVAYVHAVLASRPEEDPVLVKNSSQIDLVVHMLFEQASFSLLRSINGAPDLSAFEAIKKACGEHQPRYVLVEARRCSNSLARSTSRV